MTLFALLLVLLAAVAHATWNLLAKSSGDKLAFTWCSLVAAGFLYAPLALYVALREGMAPGGWVFALGTVAMHTVYFTSLARGYQSGDLSLVYPVARGMGPMLVPLLAIGLLGERMSLLAGAGVVAVVAGVFVVHLPGHARVSRRALAQSGTGYALITGLTIAAYSIWDKLGVGLVPPALYNYFLFAGTAITLAPIVLLSRREKARQEWRQRRGAIIAVGILSPLAYLLILSALTFSPVSYIAPAREVSIPAGAALGALVLREPYGGSRLLGSLLIAVGVVALALA